MADTPLKPKGTGSAPFALAYWFVTEYLVRPWGVDDDKGRHLKHAQILLRDDSMELIKHCLLAMRDGRVPIGKFEVRWLVDIRNGEPPFVAQYRALALTPPPQWKTASFHQWKAEFDPHWVPPTLLLETDPCPIHYPPPTSPSSGRLHTVGSRR